MSDELKHAYFGLLLPVVAGFIVLRLLDGAGLLPFDSRAYVTILAPSLFILAALFSLGLPILYRAGFAARMKTCRLVSGSEFQRFERQLIYIALMTPYLALLALAFKVPGFHFSGIFLMSLYAAYYFYPSRKRIAFEKRMFRVDHFENTVDPETPQ